MMIQPVSAFRGEYGTLKELSYVRVPEAQTRTHGVEA